MWTETPVFVEDLKRICGDPAVDWDALRGGVVVVTGATGLIGQTLVSALAYANIHRALGLRVVALVRDRERAERMFAGQLRDGRCLEFAVGTVEALPELPERADFIVHGASMTSSQAFIETPVEMLRTAVRGTENVLEYARAAGARGMVYLSSMEVYGHPEKGRRVTEDDMGALPTTVVRNAYPLGKQLCESLCCAYASEYGVPVRIARLTQTFGPGVRYDDTRVFAEFARCAIEKRDIVLKTKGETERCYLYTADAASALLTLLTKGAAGEAYNVANEATYCSIAQMAETVAALGGIRVRYEIQNVTRLGYASTLYMDLDTRKLQGLGWAPTLLLEDMYRNLMGALQLAKN